MDEYDDMWMSELYACVKYAIAQMKGLKTILKIQLLLFDDELIEIFNYREMHVRIVIGFCVAIVSLIAKKRRRNRYARWIFFNENLKIAHCDLFHVRSQWLYS